MNHSSDIERDTVGGNNAIFTSATIIRHAGEEGRKKVGRPKTEDKVWEDIETYYKHAVGAKPVYYAFKADSNAHLFILVIKVKDEKKDKIYVFKKGKTTIEDELDHNTINEEIVPDWKKLKTNINDKSEVITKGKFFKEHLLRKVPETLITEITGDIWIYCEDEYIEPLWEWLYTTFFWGHKFHIFRIPVNCDFSVSDFEVQNFAFLKDESCKRASTLSNKIHGSLKSILTCPNRSLQSLEYDDLKSYDCINISAKKETFEEKTFNKIIAKISSRIAESNKKLNLKFLFLNTFCEATSRMHPSPAELISVLSPLAWVDCSLEISEKNAKNFILKFYKATKDSLKNNKEANVVEIFETIRKELIEQGGFWPFGYIIRGNPHCKLKLA